MAKRKPNKVPVKTKRSTTKEPIGKVFTAIEQDARGYWHPVITIRERGTVVYQITAVDGVYKSTIAHIAALKEARRLELSSV